MNKITFYLLLVASCLSGACTNDSSPEDNRPNEGELHISASVAGMTATRTGGSDLPDGSYTLYLPLQNHAQTQTYEASSGALTATAPLYWDDVTPATTPAETAFYFSNVAKDEVMPTHKDILWGTTTGWNKALVFTLAHKMSKLSVELTDATDGQVLTFANAKVVVNTELSPQAASFDPRTGALEPAAKKKELRTVALTELESTSANSAHKATLTFGTVPPQLFQTGTVLTITAGKYLFYVDLPAKFTDAANTEQDLKGLTEGNHLTIKITLKEKVVEATATLTDWITKDAGDIEVSRVFNIASEEELKDLALAVNSGSTFEGLVIRQTADIALTNPLRIGSKQYPFKGIYDGGKKKLSGIGSDQTPYTTPIFGYTEGATFQNILLENPYVKGAAALVEQAKNTLFFECTLSGGQITGTGKYTGSLVGRAEGSTSFTNCYAEAIVSGGSADYVGGLVGYSEGTINHCSAKGAVTGGNYVGGLAGFTAGQVQNCFAWGAVAGTNNYIGGLIGYADGNLQNSYAAGAVTKGTGVDAGGLVGSIGFNGSTLYCFWNAANDKGSGIADLGNTCEAFTLGTDDIATDEKLNKSNAGVWESATPQTINGTSYSNVAIFK